jgi:hypothetical protein
MQANLEQTKPKNNHLVKNSLLKSQPFFEYDAHKDFLLNNGFEDVFCTPAEELELERLEQGLRAYWSNQKMKEV